MSSQPKERALVPRLQRALEATQAFHTKLLLLLIDASEELKSAGALGRPEIADVGFLCREMENIYDELRKEVKARKELAGRIIAEESARRVTQDPSAEMNVRGTLCTAQPDVKLIPSIPRPGSPEYERLCQHFGVAEEFAGLGVIRYHFNTMVDYLAKLMAEGRPLPDGIVKTYSQFTTVFRTRSSAKKED